MRSSRTPRWSSAILVLALLVQFPSPALATHTTACQEPSVVNRFEGRGKPVTGIAGVQANVEGDYPEICSTAGDGDASNLIFVGIDANDGQEYSIIQAGSGNCSNANPACGTGSMQWWAWGRAPGSSNCELHSEVIPAPKRLGSLPATSPAYQVVRTSSQWQVWITAPLRRLSDSAVFVGRRTEACGRARAGTVAMPSAALALIQF